jgi:hypothetical protein
MIHPTISVASCLQHGANPVTAYCVRCGRPMCELCTFWIGSAIFCPECVSSGPSAGERSSVAVKGILSILLAVLGAVELAGLMVLRASGGLLEGVYLAMGLLILGTTSGGISLALVGREGAQRTGSMLPLVGLVLNVVILGVYAIMRVIDTLMG